MFEVGAKVLYGVHGVCIVTGLEKQLVNKKWMEYYALEPVEQPGARYLIPTGNEAAVAKLRPILTREQVLELLHSDQVRKNAWIEDENARKQRYRELIHSGNRTALISMVGTLQLHKLKIQEAGKKFHLCDENFLRDAQKLLSAEFALVMNIPQQEIGEFIQKEIYGE